MSTSPILDPNVEHKCSDEDLIPDQVTVTSDKDYSGEINSLPTMTLSHPLSSSLNDGKSTDNGFPSTSKDMQHTYPTSHPKIAGVGVKVMPQGLIRSSQGTQGVPTTFNHARPPMSHWQSWIEVRIQLQNIPRSASIKDLYDGFTKEGKITSLEIFEEKGARTGRGYMIFRPPPTRAFWGPALYKLDLHGKGCFDIQCTLSQFHRSPEVPSPSAKARKYPERMDVRATSFDIGVMKEPNKMISKESIADQNALLLNLNLRYEELCIEFPLTIPNPPHPTKTHQKPRARSELWKIVVPFNQIQALKRVSSSNSRVRFLMDLELPPKYYRQVPGTQPADTVTNKWSEKEAWYRQTDIVSDHRKLRSASVSLQKRDAYLDIGRCRTFVVEVDMPSTRGYNFRTMQQALQDYNLAIQDLGEVDIESASESSQWGAMAGSPTEVGGQQLSQNLRLTFEVQYQLDVCISKGILNEHNITAEFIDRIATMNDVAARELLEQVANEKTRIFEPTSIFDQEFSAQSIASVPGYCTISRSIFVTPTTVRLNSPTVEISNRIVREFAEYGDRFIRVRFTDEAPKTKIFPSDGNQQNELYTRIKRTFANGIRIGDRHFIFLAFGNSQFREHGAYFFAPHPDLSRKYIRAWMGCFDEIKHVALFASRLGQCFSTTWAIYTPKSIVEIDDVHRNGYCFSDGVGRISPQLALDVADHLKLKSKSRDVPSVFQFRLGGCKGVLTVWPQLRDQTIHIRKTQYKFPAKKEEIEIIRYSQYAAANLNRQIILVLSSLGVPDRVFEQKLSQQLADIDTAMHDMQKAIEVLNLVVDHNQMTLKMADMIQHGFQERNEPFISCLLRLWRAWSKKYLKEKARITVDQGAILLGCMDETGSLQGHTNDNMVASRDLPVEQKIPYLPQVFVQVCNGPEKRPEIKTGPMLLARNPSLHPGDIRVVCGVDVEALHHLRDCVVLPRNGDRDVANMCSGGDLDGDDFEVIWDPDLLPVEWNHDPMDFTAPERINHAGEITDNDLTNFFITYMKNDTLPRIAHAHVAIADSSEQGVKDGKCLELAALHSLAVDFVKTGRAAKMSPDLRPRRWPHFMEKKRPANQIYRSEKVLGKLFDQVERIAFEPDISSHFDERVLKAFDTSDDMLRDAATVKVDYDNSVQRLMAQHAIKTEFEIWTSFVMEHNHVNDFKLGEEIGKISSALKDHFREVCTTKAGGKDYEHLAPFVTAMYTVTADEVKRARAHESEDHNRPRPLISFPWLFQDILGRIVQGHDFQSARKQQTGGENAVPMASEDAADAPVAPLQSMLGGIIKDDDRDGIKIVGEKIPPSDILQLFENGTGNTERLPTAQGEVHPAETVSNEEQDEAEPVKEVLPKRKGPSIYEQFAALGFDTNN